MHISECKRCNVKFSASLCSCEDKDKQIFKSAIFMTLQTGEQTIAVHILPDISKSKGNQTMKLGQLIKYDMRKFFLTNHA